MASMMVSLRWDGPHLSKQQLMQKASATVEKVGTAFDHVDQLDVQAMPDEAGQYVQLIVNTSANDSDCQRMMKMLKDEFSADFAKQKREAAQRAEEERAVQCAKERRLAVQQQRKDRRRCVMCGKKLGLFDRINGREQHVGCTIFQE